MISSLLARLKKAVVPVVIILFALSVFGYLKATKPKQQPVAVTEKVWPVEVVQVNPSRNASFQVLYGKVESEVMVTAASPVNGVVGEVYVSEGDSVAKGDKLVALAQADLELPLIQAKADVADIKAQIQLEQSTHQTNLLRLEKEKSILKIKQESVSQNAKLIDKNLTAQSALDQAKEALARQEFTLLGAQLAVEQYDVKLAQLQARLAKAEAALSRAKVNRERGQLVAPFDARIAQVSVSAGDSVGMNAPLVRFYALDSLQLRAQLPVSKMPAINQALQSGEALHAEYNTPNQSYALPLLRLAGESKTSGIDAFFALPEPLKSTRPGDLMKVYLQNQTVENSVAVPYTALYGSDSVYQVKDGVLQHQTVTLLGDILVDKAVWALVSGNFSADSLIMTTHLPNAISGLKVQVVTHE